MQLLGKHYFGQNGITVPASDGGKQDVPPAGDGLEALCRAVEESGKHRLKPLPARTLKFLRENKKQLAAAASVAVIGFAVYLNWALYRNPANDADAAGSPPQAAGIAALSDGTGTALSEVLPVQSGEEPEPDYFAVSQINRQRARDEAIEVLQNVADGAANLNDVREDALAEIAKIAADIENEAAIESLVKGKGFDACVAVISGDTANVIVKSAALLPNEVTQIQEIVYETAGILPVNVRIIEK